METFGIDVSVNPKRTVACRIEWSGGRAHVAAPVRPVNDDRFVELLSGGGPCGIDVPFGWPIRFVEAVVAHQRFARWLGGEDANLAYRATDRWVASQTKWNPLSVSTDHIGRTAFRGARVMSKVSDSWPQNYRAGVVGGVVEVYPAAALHQWTGKRQQYKGAGKHQALRALASRMMLPWLHFDDPSVAEMYRSHEDCFDALIASLVARAHAKGLCEPIPPEHRHEAEIEGWIALPRPGSLDQLPLA